MYVVEPERPATSAGVFTVDAGADSLPVRGRLISSAKGRPGKAGDEIWFQYNATTEEEWWLTKDVIMIPPDVIYKVGDRMVNGWAFFGLKEELDNGIRTGVLIDIDHEIYTPGMKIMAPRGLSHRVIPKMFSDRNLYAIKSEYIIFYIDSQ